MRRLDHAIFSKFTQLFVFFGGIFNRILDEGLARLSIAITTSDSDYGDLSLALIQALTLPASPRWHSPTASRYFHRRISRCL
jgi:hypothetical protein